MPLGLQPRRHSSAAIERGSRVLPIDQSHQSQILLALFDRFVVQARPAHSQQGTLPPHADGRMFRFYPAAPIFIRAGQLFFSPTPTPSLAGQSARTALRNRTQRPQLFGYDHPQRILAVALGLPSSTAQSAPDGVGSALPIGSASSHRELPRLPPAL